MRKLLLAAAVLLLSSCEPGGSSGKDGYTFGEPEFTRTEMRLTVVVHPDVEALRRALPGNVRLDGGRELMAFGILRQGACEVHVVDPGRAYQPEWMGHELAHCVWGRWHA
jgi:hypothetical protein